MVEIRECAEPDVGALEESMPSYGAALHAEFLQRQRVGEATYLVAWAGDRPVGSGLVRWAGHRDAASRVAMPGTPVISNLGVLPAWRGRGVGGELVAAAEQRISGSAATGRCPWPSLRTTTPPPGFTRGSATSRPGCVR